MSKLSGEGVGRTSDETSANVRRYWEAMGPQVAADLHAARSKLVKAYRENPRLWPDGIDTKWGRWYRAEEWTDEGGFLGAAINTPEMKAEKRSVARAALEKVEGEWGVKGAGRPGLGEPWVALGISRRTYFAKKAAGEL